MIPNHKIKYRSTHQHNKVCSGMNAINLFIYLNNFLEFLLLRKTECYTSPSSPSSSTSSSSPPEDLGLEGVSSPYALATARAAL
jgi:hypothetical protein